MAMTREHLAALADLADTEPAFTRVSLDNLGNEALLRQQLQTELEKHFRAKESAQGLVDRIKSVMQTTTERASTIAQTERTRALNGSRISRDIRQYLEDYDKAVQGHRKRPEVPRYMWINPRRAKEPREEHLAISGDVHEIGEEFLPSLRYPGDPQAPPSQTIRCHCYLRRVN